MHAQARLDDGEDSFTTPNERRRRALAEKRHRDAMAKAERALDAACDAMHELLMAYREAFPDAPYRVDDGRRLLMESMREYSLYLGSVKDRVK